LQLLDKLEAVKLEHVPQSANKMAGVLANLAATLALGLEQGITIPVCGQWVVTPPLDEGAEEVKIVPVSEIDEGDWRQPLINYLEHRRLLSELRHKNRSGLGVEGTVGW